MHRQFSLKPFSRHYSHSTNPFLDFLEIEQASSSSSSDPSPRISVTPEKRQELLEVLTAYKSVQASRTLHTLTFVTVNDYLWLLRAVTQELSMLLKRKAMFYLAAAVSDFFLPRQKMVREIFLKIVVSLFMTMIYAVRTQDTIRQRKFINRNGPSTKDFETYGRRVDEGRFYCFFQG